MKTNYDVIIAGGGVAGISTAIACAEQGMTVGLVERQKEGKRQEKSLFLNGDHFDPKLIEELEQGGNIQTIPGIVLINADDRTRNWQKKGDQFRTCAVQHGPLINSLLRRVPANVDIIESPIISNSDDGISCSVTIRGNKFSDRETTLSSKNLVDASGDFSHISRKHRTKNKHGLVVDDPIVMWMWGVRGHGKFNPDILYDPIGKDIGTVSWVTGFREDYGDIISAGYCRLSEVKLRKYQPKLDSLIQFCRKNDLCDLRQIEYRLGGVIRSEPIALKDVLKSRRVWITGQAAGMADPLMAEALSPAYKLAKPLAKSIANGNTPDDFYKQWRYGEERMFNYPLMLAMLYRRIHLHSKGIVGGNSELYKLLIEHMSEDAQERALKSRSVSLRDIMHSIIPILEHPKALMAGLDVAIRSIGIFLTKDIAPRLNSP